MNDSIDTTAPAGGATRRDWFEIACKMEDALSHIETLASLTSSKLIEHMERVEGTSDDRDWLIPNSCMSQVEAVIFAIRSTAALAQHSHR